MNKTLPTFRYLTKSLSVLLVSGFLITLGTVAVVDLVFYLTDRASTNHQVVSLTVPFEFVTGIFALLIGVVLFITNFKVALANGVSRKTFLLANLPTAGIAAGVFSVFVIAVIKLHGSVWLINSISELFYPNMDLLWFLVFQFTLYFLLIMIGRFISLAYYRSSIPAKWTISLAPFVLFGLLEIANARAGGAIFAAFRDYLHWSLWPTRVATSLLAYSAILFGLTFLLMRRTPLKD